MARLAAERLGDTRLAIEIHNSDPRREPADARRHARGARGALRAREALPRARRDPASPAHAAGGRQGSDRAAREARPGLRRPARARRSRRPRRGRRSSTSSRTTPRRCARCASSTRWPATSPGSSSCTRKLGQEEELVEALLAIADRIDAKAARLPLVERAAAARPEARRHRQGGRRRRRRSRRRARSGSACSPSSRTHVGAATALAPIYTKQEKWARLITVLEIELGAAHGCRRRLAKIAQIRQLCEQKLSSRKRSRSRGRCARSSSIRTATQLYADVMRLANEPEQWRDVAAAFERAIAGGTLARADRGSKLYPRARARSRASGSAIPRRARGYHRQVLQLAPEDRDAESHLEELATRSRTGPSCSRRIAGARTRETRDATKAGLLMEIAALQEQKLVDLDGAAATYHEALELVPGAPQGAACARRGSTKRAATGSRCAEVLAAGARSRRPMASRASSC